MPVPSKPPTEVTSRLAPLAFVACTMPAPAAVPRESPSQVAPVVLRELGTLVGVDLTRPLGDRPAG